MLAISDTELDRYLFALHFEEKVDVCEDDFIVVTAVEHPAYSTEFFELLGSGCTQIFYGRSLCH